MRVADLLGSSAMLLFACLAFSQTQSHGPKDTLAAAQLSPKETRQIISAVEQSAYDTPDSWSSELRAKRIDLGNSQGLVLQGSNLLCGGTGNCQLFVFRKVKDTWVSLFEVEHAPLAESFQFGPGTTRGIKDLMIATNSRAESTERVTYKFDGTLYRSK